MRIDGFNVTIHNETAINPLKTKLGVPQALASCHTATVDDYVIEGHVPGMPIGSPGMEQRNQHDAYATLAFTSAGESSVYAKH